MQQRSLSFIALFLICSALGGCFRQAYHVSPFNGANSPYHTIPLHSDSVRSASYANVQLYTGQGNQQARDRKFALGLDISRSHNFGSFQAYYAGGVTLGNYHVNRYDSLDYVYYGYGQGSLETGNFFYGGAGFDGGLNLVLPFDGGEWRALGVETSLRQEFGSYADYRKRIPDSLNLLVIRKRFFATAGVYTEILAHFNDGGVAGMKVGYGRALGWPYTYRFDDYYEYGYNPLGLRFHYFNVDFHYTLNRVTGYLHVATAGKAESAALGVNFRLGR